MVRKHTKAFSKRCLFWEILARLLFICIKFEIPLATASLKCPTILFKHANIKPSLSDSLETPCEVNSRKTAYCAMHTPYPWQCCQLQQQLTAAVCSLRDVSAEQNMAAPTRTPHFWTDNEKLSFWDMKGFGISESWGRRAFGSCTVITLMPY